MIARKLLTVGHSYVVSLNRRLAHEMAIAGKGRWDVTCVAPSYFHGGNDLGPIAANASPKDAYAFEAVPAHFTSGARARERALRLARDRARLSAIFREALVVSRRR